MRASQLFSLSALIGLCLIGCADNNTTLFVDHAVPRTLADECIVTFDADSNIQSRGVYDTATDCGYELNLQLGNQLQLLADDETLRAETSRITIEGAEVSILDPAKNPVIPEFSTNQNGVIDPAGGGTPGYGGVSVQVIPPGLNLDDGEYVIRVRVFGQTLGNTSVQSNYFFYPITVGTNNLSSSDPECTGGCNPGQDLCYPAGVSCAN